jgi:addiction module HigA family antidote
MIGPAIKDIKRHVVMHNPPHPGEFIQATYMEPFGLSGRYLAEQLDVAASTLNRVLKKQSGVSPEMALRLSKALGRSPESWLAMWAIFPPIS